MTSQWFGVSAIVVGLACGGHLRRGVGVHGRRGAARGGQFRPRLHQRVHALRRREDAVHRRRRAVAERRYESQSPTTEDRRA